MTNRERVIAAIKGEPVDRVPVSFSLHFPKDEAKGEAGVRSHLDFYRESGVDIMKIMNENLVPVFEKYEGPSSWSHFPSYSRHDKFITDQIDFCKRIMDESPDGTFFLGTVHGICASMIHPFEPQVGYDAIRAEQVRAFRENKTGYLDAAKKVTEAMNILIEEQIKAGVDAIYYAALGGEKRYFTGSEFNEAFMPFDLEMLSTIKNNGAYSFLHICKDGLDMGRYASYAPFADVVNWGIYEDNYFTLEDGRKMFPEATIMGGLANRKGVIVDGSDDELEAAVKNIISGFGKEKFILGADCTLPTEIPYSRIHKIVDYSAEV